MSLELMFKSAVGAIIGYFMWKFKRIEEQSNKAVTQEEVHRIFDQRSESLNIKIDLLREDHKEVKTDIKYIVQKIDKIS